MIRYYLNEGKRHVRNFHRHKVAKAPYSCQTVLHAAAQFCRNQPLGVFFYSKRRKTAYALDGDVFQVLRNRRSWKVDAKRRQSKSRRCATKDRNFRCRESRSKGNLGIAASWLLPLQWSWYCQISLCTSCKIHRGVDEYFYSLRRAFSARIYRRVSQICAIKAEKIYSSPRVLLKESAAEMCLLIRLRCLITKYHEKE